MERDLELGVERGCCTMGMSMDGAECGVVVL